ncbi:hypothetical protein Alg130_10919, partial [Pyrenophora tritici-repentis]
MEQRHNQASIYGRPLLAKIERQRNGQVVIIRLDMEAGYIELLEICRDLGIAVEPRATEAQNGGIEHAGKSIVIRARTIRLHAGLLKAYANECAITAIYLLNHTLVEAIDWSCPYTKVKGVKPFVSHLEVIGAGAYVLNEKLLRGAKLESRALIGHLGYEHEMLSSLEASSVTVKLNDTGWGRGYVLAPEGEESDNQRTKMYQELVGSLAYISTYTQP